MVATITIGFIIAALVATGNVELTWSFSAVTGLVYYAITNLAALVLSETSRMFSRAFAWLGLASCAFLALWIREEAWVAASILVFLGLGWHLYRTSRSPARPGV